MDLAFLFTVNRLYRASRYESEARRLYDRSVVTLLNPSFPQVQS
jgi:hypothetical protein